MADRLPRLAEQAQPVLNGYQDYSFVDLIFSTSVSRDSSKCLAASLATT